MTNVNTAVSLERLKATLETYGADRTRWPVQRRHELSHFIASSSEAQRLISEAAVFDRLLDMAPTLDASREEALLAAILKKAGSAPRVVIENERAKTRSAPAVQPRNWRRWSGAGAALAASLMLGVIVGQLNSFGTVADDLAEAAGIENSTASQQLAQTDDNGYFDEDLL